MRERGENIMALADRYDFSLFETHQDYGNAAPALPEREYPTPRLVPKPKQKPVKKQKPKLDPETRKRVLLEPLRVIERVFIIALATGFVGFLIQRNVMLTELTDQIEKTTQELSIAQSTETQLQLQLDARLNNLDLEHYAQTELGMSKITRSQVVYINTESEDRGTVYQEYDVSPWQSFLVKLENFWHSLVK